ncbi:MAG: aminotransferase class III-fold pyridoxal phosphate-dependent enzyme [Rhodospirillaceae bacterium]|nr:aminotransferase class III-fold pyridoxal phosphate-dependent enzyme [Rhodospirillaceae bacterium]
MVSTKKGQEMYDIARRLIPGGTQLLSKRPEIFLPGGWPSYYAAASGITVTDLDGNTYRDFAIGGVGATVLGYADPDVDNAVKAAIEQGSMSTLNAPEEVVLAERLIDLHPWADMARFSRAGGEAMAVAVRIARTHARRATVAVCGYHGWHDWYLSANLAKDDALDGHLLPGLNPAGVPRGLKGLTRPFQYNDFDALNSIVSECGDDLAAIVMEPARDSDSAAEFVKGVREIANQTRAVLIFDEITSGFRLTTGGLHLALGVDPDIAVFAKALGNGYPISAIIGRREIMQAAQNTFISSTSWTERIGPAAALAVLNKFEKETIADHLVEIGQGVKQVWLEAADHTGLKVTVSGLDPLAHLEFLGESAPAQRTLFTQEMLDRGFLAGPAFYAMAAHTSDAVADYADACREVFRLIASAASTGSIEGRLRGPIAHSGFKRLT